MASGARRRPCALKNHAGGGGLPRYLSSTYVPLEFQASAAFSPLLPIATGCSLRASQRVACDVQQLLRQYCSCTGYQYGMVQLPAAELLAGPSSTAVPAKTRA